MKHYHANPQRIAIHTCKCLQMLVASVSLSVTKLTAGLKVENKELLGFLYGIFKIRIVWISLKMLCSKILATFDDQSCLLHFLMSSQWTKETVIISFLEQ